MRTTTPVRWPSWATRHAMIVANRTDKALGIAIAVFSMIVNFAFVPYYPVWFLLIIALNVFVIWALCVFNRDAAAQV